MKGFFFIHLLLFGIIFYTHAQARIALVGGIHESNVLQTSNTTGFDVIKKGYKPRAGFNFGIVGDFPLQPKSNFYFSPGIQYVSKGRKFSQASGDSFIYQTNKVQYINYIDIPLNLIYRLRISKQLSLIFGAGPYLSFFYNGKISTEILGPNNFYAGGIDTTNLSIGNGAGKYTTFDYGLNALAGLYMGSVFITANYSRGLQNFYQDPDYPGSFKHQVIGLSMGVYLGERIKNNKNKPVKPEDKDGDGIADKNDLCPATPGISKYNGCPIPDTDSDGINDENDKCPTIAGSIKYNGCPIPDTDSDGVNDEIDKCPTVAGLEKYHGCLIPVDSTLTASKVDKDSMCYFIFFDANRITLNTDAYNTLDKIRQLLKTNANLNISISGHSDKVGTENSALLQSKERTIVARDYLKSYYVPDNRIITSYWGSKRPIINDSSINEHWKNSRVELCVYAAIKISRPPKNLANQQDINNDTAMAVNKKQIIEMPVTVNQHNKKIATNVIDEPIQDEKNKVIVKSDKPNAIDSNTNKKPYRTLLPVHNNYLNDTSAIIVSSYKKIIPKNEVKNVDNISIKAKNNTDEISHPHPIIAQLPNSELNKYPVNTDKNIDCYTIYFDPNQVILNTASFEILSHIRDILKNNNNFYITISGYSEKIGSEASALKLSEGRASLVNDYLKSYNINPGRMRVSHWGSKLPVADDADALQHWKNRRVEICIYEYPK